MTRVRRLLPGREPAGRWWDVDFLPLRQTGEKAAVLILGRITLAAAEEAAPAVPMPERLVALRERMTQRFGPDLLTDTSPALRRLAEQVRLAGRTTAPVLLVGEPGVGKQTLARLIHYQSPTPGTALRRPRLRPPAGRRRWRTCCSAVYAGPSGRFTFTTRRACRATCNYASAKSFMPRPKKTPARGAAHPGRLRRGPGGRGPRRPTARRTLFRPGRADHRHSAAAGASSPTCRRWWTGCCNAATRRANPRSRACRPTPGTWSANTPGRATSGNCTPSCPSARRHARTDRITAADLPASLKLLRRLEETPGRRPERPLPLDALLEQAERRLIDMALRRAKGKKYRAAEILAIWRTRLMRRMKALGIGDAEADDASGEGGSDASAPNGGA